MLSPVRLGKKQDDGEAFLDDVSWCLECWPAGLVVVMVVVVLVLAVVVAEVEEEAGQGGRRLVGSCRPRTLGLGESRRVAEGRRWEEVLDDCVSYGMYGGPRGKHTNHASGRTRRLPGAPRFDGVL